MCWLYIILFTVKLYECYVVHGKINIQNTRVGIDYNPVCYLPGPNLGYDHFTQVRALCIQQNPILFREAKIHAFIQMRSLTRVIQ